MINHGVLKLSDFGWSTYAPTLYIFFYSAKGRLSAELLTTSRHKLLKGVSMMKELIFGPWVSCCTNWQLERLPLKQNTKISHTKRLSAVIATFLDIFRRDWRKLLGKYLIKILRGGLIWSRLRGKIGSRSTRVWEGIFLDKYGDLGPRLLDLHIL